MTRYYKLTNGILSPTMPTATSNEICVSNSTILRLSQMSVDERMSVAEIISDKFGDVLLCNIGTEISPGTFSSDDLATSFDDLLKEYNEARSLL